MVETDDDRERAETGEYVQTIRENEVLSAMIHDLDDPVVTATEVGEAINMSHDTALRRLRTLHEWDMIERKKVGGRSVVWWLTEDVRDPPFETTGTGGTITVTCDHHDCDRSVTYDRSMCLICGSETTDDEFVHDEWKVFNMYTEGVADTDPETDLAWNGACPDHA